MRGACGSSTDLGSLDPRFRPYADAFVRWIARQGFRVHVTSAGRTRATQECLYRRAQAGLSKYPAAVPGQSMHERGLAVDLDVQPASILRTLGPIWEKWSGGQWGGRSKLGYDPIHFQMKQFSTRRR